MATNSLINYLKYNPKIFRIIKSIVEIGLKIISFCVRTDSNLILFVCFGGRKYDDSPRCIYEAMLSDNRFRHCKFVWAFRNPEAHDIGNKGIKIKIDTYSYFITALKAKVWITNSAVTRGLNFKGRDVFYFNTWHGSAIKKLGNDMHTNPYAYYKKTTPKLEHESIFDVFCAQSNYDISIFSKCFNIPIDRFQLIGLPRNDVLASRDKQFSIELKSKLNIPPDKQVILYAPTFREYNRDQDNNCIHVPPINLHHWALALEDRFVLLFRAHYEVVKTLEIDNNSFCINVSNYPSLNDLILISDILISDFSSIFMDFSITGKPMICWAYDYNEYTEKRGVYFDIRKSLENYITTEDELINTIKTLDVSERSHITTKFRSKYVETYGNATENALNIIYKHGLK